MSNPKTQQNQLELWQWKAAEDAGRLGVAVAGGDWNVFQNSLRESLTCFGSFWMVMFEGYHILLLSITKCHLVKKINVPKSLYKLRRRFSSRSVFHPKTTWKLWRLLMVSMYCLSVALKRFLGRWTLICDMKAWSMNLHPKSPWVDEHKVCTSHANPWV